MHHPGLAHLAALLALSLSAAPAWAQEKGEDFPKQGELIYESKCLLCHPTSPSHAKSSEYKARPNAVPLWPLYDAKEGWQESNIGLGQWSDDKMNRFLKNPKALKQDSDMIRVPMEPSERKAVIRYLKYLGSQN